MSASTADRNRAADEADDRLVPAVALVCKRAGGLVWGPGVHSATGALASTTGAIAGASIVEFRAGAPERDAAGYSPPSPGWAVVRDDGSVDWRTWLAHPSSREMEIEIVREGAIPVDPDGRFWCPCGIGFPSWTALATHLALELSAKAAAAG